MRIAERCRTLVDLEHRHLRNEIDRFREALTALADERRGRSSSPDRSRVFEIQSVLAEVGPLGRAVGGRLDRFRDEFVPLVDRYDAGEDGVLAGAIEVVTALQEARTAIEGQLSSIRRQGVLLEAAKGPLHALNAAFAAVDFAEEGEVFAALVAGSRQTQPPAAARRTGDDVARSLRTNRPPREPDPTPGILDRVMGWFRR